MLGGFYGICMGLFAAVRGTNGTSWQMVASALKIPMLFLLTLLVTFPSLYVFSALSRSPLQFRASLHMLIRSIAVSIVLLASFGPITAFFTLSTSSYPFMVLLNVVMLTFAGIAGLKYLASALETMIDALAKRVNADRDRREFVAPDSASRILRIWIYIYGIGRRADGVDPAAVHRLAQTWSSRCSAIATRTSFSASSKSLRRLFS